MPQGQTLRPSCRMEIVRKEWEKTSASVVWAELMTSAELGEHGACGASRQNWREAAMKYNNFMK